MDRKDTPIFGKNGAVLNSEMMTDEWREEHDRASPFGIGKNSKQAFIEMIPEWGGMIGLICVINNRPIDTPIWIVLLAAIGAGSIVRNITRSV